MAMVGRGDGRELGGDRQGDVFPALGAMVFGGAHCGLRPRRRMISTELVPSSKSLPTQVILGAALGAILGLFVGLSRGVWRLGQPLRTSFRNRGPSLSPHRRALGPMARQRPRVAGDRFRIRSRRLPEEARHPAQIESFGGFAAERARVRPRIISPETGEAIPLEDEIGPLDPGRPVGVGRDSRRTRLGKNDRAAAPGGDLASVGVRPGAAR